MMDAQVHRPTSPGVDVAIGGETYTLRLDLTALADFERETGKSVLALLSDIMRIFSEGAADVDDNPAGYGAAAFSRIMEQTALSVADLQVLLWACIGGDDSGISLREAGRLLHIGNVAEVGGAMAEAFARAMPTGSSDAPEGGEDPTNSPTG